MSTATLLMSEIEHAPPLKEPCTVQTGSSSSRPQEGGGSEAALPGESVDPRGHEARRPSGGSAAPAASASDGDGGGAEHEGPGPEEAVDGAKAELLDALERMDVPSELLDYWASMEAAALAPQQPPPRAPGPAGARADAPPAIPARARQVCLRCLRALAEQHGLSQDDWFDSAALFDSYVQKAGARITVADLPPLCTVILRMQWKEDAMAREDRRTTEEDWAEVSSWVAGTLAGAGYSEALEQAVPFGERTFADMEVALLNALQWHIHVPHLAKWTTAYFTRLQVFARAVDHGRILAARESALDEAARLTLLQAPSPRCPPQRLARGLLLVQAETARITPPAPPSANGLLQSFEAVTGSPASTLQEDYDVARRMLQQASLLRPEQM